MNKNRKLGKRSKSFESLLVPAPEGKPTCQPSRLITLLTDFGLTDTYVGVMKGVIASISSRTKIIDLCHNVEPQDVHEAAFLLAGSFTYFPPGAIHVVVVDPTVGSDRRAICVQSGQYFFIGPDNGVISPACYRAGRPKIHVLENRAYFLEKQSKTFHGRDIFAPAAAHLSRGAPIESFGPKVRSMVRMRFPAPVILRAGRLKGEILHIDRFGNLITNIDEMNMAKVFGRTDQKNLVISCGDSTIVGLCETYSEVVPGAACALFGSYNLMEIAVRDGNASSALGIKRGEKVGIALAKR